MSEHASNNRESLDFDEVAIGDLISVVSGTGDEAATFNLMVTEMTDGSPYGEFTILHNGKNTIGAMPVALLGCVTVDDEKIHGLRLGAYIHFQPWGKGGSIKVTEPGKEISQINLVR